MSIITKGTRLEIQHSRKGTFMARAYEDFDPETVEWLPVVVDQPIVEGINLEWEQGEKLPCRRMFCTFKVIEEQPSE